MSCLAELNGKKTRPGAPYNRERDGGVYSFEAADRSASTCQGRMHFEVARAANWLVWIVAGRSRKLWTPEEARRLSMKRESMTEPRCIHVLPNV